MSQKENPPKVTTFLGQVKKRRALFMAISIFLLCHLLPLFSPLAQAIDVPIPKDVSREDVLKPSRTVKDRLHKYVKDYLALKKKLEQEVDDYVIFIDHDGQPILPDLEEARERLRIESTDDTGLSAQVATETNELTFTFDSPTYPWSPDELDLMNTALTDLYPVAKAIYGDPAFNITVNVRKDPTIVNAGLYYPSINEIVIRGASSQDNLDELCHEMIHAFRDDIVILLNSYEEGMTRAAEVEVFNQLADYNHWDENHRYYQDVYYEALNRQIIGSLNGRFTNLFTLRRYQLSGYAWAKAFLENSTFFVDFNRELYLGTLLASSIIAKESKLFDIASTIQSSVEGKPFPAWYKEQGVLNTDPPKGYFLFVTDLNGFSAFFRDQSGREYVLPNTAVQWSIFDYQDTLLGSDNGVTSAFRRHSWMEI